MRQVTLLEPGRFTRQERPPPDVPAGHVLVRPHRVGICGTDLHAFNGRQPYFTYPRVLGHELGVEVLSVPPGDHGLRPGDRCAVEPYLWCGQCQVCRAGKPNACENMRVLGVHTDGGMCGRLAVPVDKLYRSDKLTFEQLALVETLGIGYHAVERGQVRAEDGVLVVGAGPIGLAAVEFATAAGAKVRVLDVNAARRAFAAEHWNVETLAEPDGTLADVVIDATGSAKAMEASFDLVAFGGRLVFVGIVLDRISFVDTLFHRREMTVLSSRNSYRAFPEIIRRMESGTIDTGPWITHRLELSEVPERFAGLTRLPGLVKAVVEVSDADA